MTWILIEDLGEEINDIVLEAIDDVKGEVSSPTASANRPKAKKESCWRKSKFSAKIQLICFLSSLHQRLSKAKILIFSKRQFLILTSTLVIAITALTKAKSFMQVKTLKLKSLQIKYL